MLIVVRHGRTQANREGRLLGRLDVGLDEVGREQAAAMAAAVGPVDRIVASPLARTRETAAAWGQSVDVDDRFVELDYGDFDGVPMTEIDPDVWARWRADPSFAPPGGESMRTLGERVRAACADLVEAATDTDVVVVTHVSPIKASAAWALGVGDEVAWRMYVAPASVTRIAVSERGPSLHAFNIVDHLADLRT
ncbi:histidine phosphatase family protein [Actinospongicola halichondriae]|uniref:histidine phosphatase family protein n=1 Tax=Actinospongicola halichondriae TaxID=3236844 RepID=UPI003D4422A2